MNKRWSEEDLERLKNRGFKIINTEKAVGQPMLSNYSLDVEPKPAKAVKEKQAKPLLPTPPAGWETIYGKAPSKSNSYKIIQIRGHGSMAKTGALVKYEKDFIWQCKMYRNAGIDQPFMFFMNVYYPSMRSDLDNSTKIVLDLLQRVKAIKNDNLCCEITLKKFVDKNYPRIEFRIEPL